MDYRIEIVNLSNKYTNLRFGQYIQNAILDNDRTLRVEELHVALFYFNDKLLYEVCKTYNKSHS